MISADTNIFFAALDTDNPEHKKAKDFLEDFKDNPDFAIADYVLVELYNLLRNQTILKNPLTAKEAAEKCTGYINLTPWQYIDYLPDIGKELWRRAAGRDFARRRIFDAQLALTLVQNGVKEFATANVKDFQGFGFERVWNPLEV